MIVVDASVVVDALVGPDIAATRRLSRETILHAPHLLPLEVASALRRLVRERQLSQKGAHQALENFSYLPFTLHPHQHLLTRVWELRDNFSVYDAVYVALAEALELPLVTCDTHLSRAGGARCTIETV